MTAPEVLLPEKLMRESGFASRFTRPADLDDRYSRAQRTEEHRYDGPTVPRCAISHPE